MSSATVDRRLGLTGDKGYKPPCDCATTANITLSGEQTIDGVLTNNSRVLVKNQTTTVDNGIWRSSTASWTRDTDSNGNYDLVAGTQVLIAGGAQAYSVWTVVGTNPITIGTSAITFTQSLSAASLALLAAGNGSSLVGFIQNGTGAVARTQQSKSREWVTPYDFGAVGDGSTNDAANIQLALNRAGWIHFPDGTYFLGTTSLSILANTKLTFSRGAKFTVTSSVPANMPQAYLSINGSNVEIDGAIGSIVSNPFSVYAAKGAFIGFGASSISNIRIRNCDATWFMHGVFGSSFASTVANSVSNVVIEKCRFTSFATDIYHTGKSPTNWLIDGNVFDGTRVTPSNNGGAIGIYGAVDIANPNNFTQTNYDSDYGQSITVTNNQISPVLDRPIRLVNCKQAKVVHNTLRLGIGSYFTGGAGTTYSADAITFDLCRQIECYGNDIVGGGENGIDFLSCQDVECYGNTIKQVNTDGIYVYMSDLWTASGTSPKLSTVTTRTSLQTTNLNIYGNSCEAFIALYVGAGQNVRFRNNVCTPFRTSTSWVTGANTPLNIVLDNATASSYFTESTAYWMHDVSFDGNRQALGTPVSVTHNSGTSIFTTVGGVLHNFVTGDKVETIAGGSSNTVDFPSGLSYRVEYYVIRVSATTFKLATSWVNAFAGTAIVTTTNGLTVANSALLIRDAVLPASTQVSATYYTPASNIVLDENIPGYTAVNLFSTLPVMNPGTAFLFTKHKHQLVYDPAVDFGLARNVYSKYYDISPYTANGTTTGTTFYGISDYSIQSGGYQFVTGAKPANTIGSPADGYIKTSLW